MLKNLKYSEELQKAGFSREQAEASLKILIEVMKHNFATREDFLKLELKLENEIGKLRSDLTNQRSDLTNQMERLEYRLIIKMGTFMTIGFGVMTATLTAIIKLI